MAQTYYKFLREDRWAPVVFGFQWPKPGRWAVSDGALEYGQNGLHVLFGRNLLGWVAPELWAVEIDDAAGVVVGQHGVAARRARLVERVESWNPRTAREFACDCAERVLPIFEREHPDDDRPRRAIEVARRYARGEATVRELDLAWVEARCAADGAAWNAAGAAARAAANNVINAVAWGAARVAGGNALIAATDEWQRRHLASLLGIEVPV